MTADRCPHCGEYMPSTSTKCPRCYRSVQRKSVYRKQHERPYNHSTGEKNKTLAFFLALIPGIFGMQGLGLIYLDYKHRRGWHFLIISAILFLSLLACVSWWDSVGSVTRVLLILAIIVMSLVYISSYIAQLVETRFGSVFKLFRL